MQILTFILSFLAAIFAGAALILVVQEKRHNQEFSAAVDQRFKRLASANKDSKTALLKYIDESDKQVAASAEKLQKETNARIEKVFSAVKSLCRKLETIDKSVKENTEHIADLEQGIIPDFEMARKAADEVNKFNEGIAGILGFDPLEAMKKSRQEDD